MRTGPCALAAILLLIGTGAADASCADATGLYSGTAASSDGTKVEVTLNLYCEGTAPKAQFFTSVGDFPGTEVKDAGGHLHIAFDTRAALGSMDLTRSGSGGLSGIFDLAGDKGTAEFALSGPALAADAMTPRLDLTPAEWRADIAFYARELPKHHANAFFSLPREKFDAEIAALDKRATTANGDEMFVGLQAVTKSIGDGHTGLAAPRDRRVMPIAVAKFGDDFRIVAAGPPPPRRGARASSGSAASRSRKCGGAR